MEGFLGPLNWSSLWVTIPHLPRLVTSHSYQGDSHNKEIKIRFIMEGQMKNMQETQMHYCIPTKIFYNFAWLIKFWIFSNGLVLILVNPMVLFVWKDGKVKGWKMLGIIFFFLHVFLVRGMEKWKDKNYFYVFIVVWNNGIIRVMMSF